MSREESAGEAEQQHTAVTAAHRKDKAQVGDISKKIKQGIGDNTRSKRHEKVQNILYEGIRSIASIKTRKRKIRITHMRNEAGNIEATRKANVFAKFYKDLYSSKNDERKDEKDSEARLENTRDHAHDHDDKNDEDDEQDRQIPELTRKELMIAIT